MKWTLRARATIAIGWFGMNKFDTKDKPCVKCGGTRRYACKNPRDGFMSMCVQCQSARDTKARAANLEEYQKRVREYRKANPDVIRALRRKYQKANPEIYRAHACDRTARLTAERLECHIADDRADRIKVYLRAKYRTTSTGIMHHVDHIIPLSQGGEHSADNLQILTEEEHAEKTRKERQ